jgi:glucose-1-phosphate cytidylyltransferase
VKVVLLCGGKGTRIRSDADGTPKGLYEIGGKPILWHILKTFRAQGFREFVLCLGYRAAEIRRTLAPGGCEDAPVTCYQDSVEDWMLTMVDTGEETNTGGRIARVAPHLGGTTFMVSYGDGVADVDLHCLIDFHRTHGRLSTITAVRPWSQFGVLGLSDNGQVRRFREKPRLRAWINGGFFVFEPSVLDYLQEDPVLEEGPFRALADAEQMMAYRHNGFWACMDTYKDLLTLNDLWSSGRAAWRTWN